MLVATRDDPVLSPDSITYLSAASHLRRLDGFADFTGEPLAHFPPVFPLLLAPGGRSLLWAALVGAALAATAAMLVASLLAGRVRWPAAVVGTIVYVSSQAVVRTASTVWSETPYCVLALAMLAVLARRPLTARRAAAAGCIAGLGFLTRYAGAGLLPTGLAMVAAAAAPVSRRHLARCLGWFAGPFAALAGAWMLRNQLATGRPLGPHFEGGAGEALPTLIERTATALGRLVTDLDDVGSWTDLAGYAVLAVLAAAIVASLARRRPRPLDVGMAMFAMTSIAVPVVSRALTGTHIEARIMFPVLLAVVYYATVAVDRAAASIGGGRWGPAGERAAVLLALAAAAVWSWQGIAAAARFPDRLGRSAGDIAQFAPPLYERIDELPAGAIVLTNNPQRVWWHTGREPVRMAFTIPTPGNSHFPLSPRETVDAACTGQAYLAWFSELDNAAGREPAELRPDLAELVELRPVATVPGGELTALAEIDPAACGR